MGTQERPTAGATKMSKKSIGIGLTGLGVIGSGTAKVLLGKPESLARSTGSQLELKRIVEIDTTKHGAMNMPRNLFTTKFSDLLNDPDIDIVIELIGGEHPAFEYIKEALSHGK
ncbi:MAG: hypothetical protein FJZ88_04290, partial [Chloroflexi bacterium]|nr:hypothetical protein [Chloroflexota bacterium]